MTTFLVLQDAFSSRRLRVLQRTSASQIDLYERCPRSWFYRYIEGVESPQTPAQLRGSQIHRLIEDSLAAGKLADDNHAHAPIVRDGMRLWPFVPANGERVIERKLRMPTFTDGPEVIGYVDLADAWKDEISLIRVDVWDHKSTSDFRYVKTEDELTSNTQMVTYAKWAFDVIGADVVRVGHLYYRTKMPPRSRSVGPVIMLRERVESEWSRRLATVASMVRDARELPSGDAAPPLGSQTGECERYGGCPHRARCGFDTLGPSRNFTGEKMSDGPSLLERLNASLAPTNGMPTSAPPPPPAAPAPAPTVSPPAAGPHAHPGSIGVAGYVPGQECNGKGYYASANGQGFINVEPGHMCRACVGPQTVQPGQVLPPDAPTRTSTPEEIQAVVESKKKRGRKPKADPSEMLRVYSELNEKRGFSINEIERLQKEDGIEDALAGKITPGMMRQFGGPPVASAPPAAPVGLPAPTVFALPPPMTPAPSPAPAAQPLPAPPAQVASAPVALPPSLFAAPVPVPSIPLIPVISIGSGREDARPLPSPAAPAPPQPASIPRPPQGLTLYVDCAPVKSASSASAIAHLEDWLAPIAAKAAAEHVDRETGKRKPYSDWRFIPYVSKAVLADAIRAALITLPQTVIVSSASGGADVFIEVVTPWCATIVRPLAGVR